MNHRSLEDRSVALVLGFTLVLSSLAVLSSLLISLYGLTGGFLIAVAAYPGYLLSQAFHIVAFYVPVFLAAHGVLLLKRSVSRRSILVLNATALPFLSAAIALRLWLDPSGAGAPLLRAITANFSRLGGALMFSLLTLLLLVALVRYAFARSLVRSGACTAAGEVSAHDATADEVPGAEILGAEGAAPQYGEYDEPDLDDPERRSSPWPDSQEGGVLGPRIRALLRTGPFGSKRNGSQSNGEVEPLDDDDGSRLISVSSDETPPELDDPEIGPLAAPAALRQREAYHDAEVLDFIYESEDVDSGAEFDLQPQPEELPAGESAEDGEDAEDAVGDSGPQETGKRSAVRRGKRELAIELTGSQRAAQASATAAASRGSYAIAVQGVLKQYKGTDYGEIDDETRHAAEMLQVTLEEFKIQAEVTGIRKGPVITMFELLPAPGVKLQRITNLADNIALRLAASSVRIVAPIPGKHAVGIEIPNKRRAIVPFGHVVSDEEFGEDEYEIPLAIGKDIPGDPQIIDLAGTPHLLIAGATGSGKSVCVNSIICSILYRRSPAEVKLMLIDPKIVELKFYNDIPHLLTPVITDPKRAFQALQYCIYEMERRYSLLDTLGVRDIRSYNAKIKKQRIATEPLPYIVVIVDEFADLMTTSGKELESTVARLAAMSRAVGIHLVLATQRPSTDVITGLIKANIPSRIAFMVASKVDSRIIIDSVGAEKLLGKGDMLFASAWDPFPYRIQGAFLSEAEVERVVKEVKQYGEPEYIDDEIFVDEDDEEYAQQELEDPLMERAIEIVTSANKASASYLQRRLKIGYNRAARLIEEMERIGIVGPQQGSKPREILYSHEHA